VRQFAALLAFLFVAAFAYSVASHLASESRALVAGVVIGVVASIPAALLAALVMRSASRRDQPPLPEPVRRPPPAPQPPPPVVIVNPGQGTRSNRYATYLDGLAEPRQPRTFRVIGDGDDDAGRQQDERGGRDLGLLL
jgi:hypothetical protein